MANPVNLGISFPKTDLHMHTDFLARLDALMAERTGQLPYNWDEWRRQTMELHAGMPRLERLSGDLRNRPDLLEHHESDFTQWVTAALEAAAREGAVLLEVRGYGSTLIRPGLMTLFREAESKVRARYRNFFAELVICLWPSPPDSTDVFESCLRLREEGLAGIDLIPEPYVTEADWKDAYRWAERAADVGLGITAHAAEFSVANIEAVLSVPGLTRIGHGVHSAYNSRLLDSIADARATVEVCLTSNVVLGSVPSLAAHPIRRFVDAGVLVTLNTDHVVQFSTTIIREYELAAGLGFSEEDLLTFTRQESRRRLPRGSASRRYFQQLTRSGRKRR